MAYVEYKLCCDPAAERVADEFLGRGKFCKVADRADMCYQNRDRCQGAVSKPYVLYQPCCDKMATCVEDDSLGWGKFCNLDGKEELETYASEAPAASKPEPVVYASDAPVTTVPEITAYTSELKDAPVAYGSEAPSTIARERALYFIVPTQQKRFLRRLTRRLQNWLHVRVIRQQRPFLPKKCTLLSLRTRQPLHIIIHKRNFVCSRDCESLKVHDCAPGHDKGQNSGDLHNRSPVHCRAREGGNVHTFDAFYMRISCW